MNGLLENVVILMCIGILMVSGVFWFFQAAMG